jgi:hypothetical protein
VTCRTWMRWARFQEGRYPGDSRQWLHSPASSQARLTPASHARNLGGNGGPGPSRGPASSPVSELSGGPGPSHGPGPARLPGGVAGGCPGEALAHPWATARPSTPVTVTHHFVAGLRAKAAASARESAPSRGPNPATSPGEGDQPSHVERGNTRFTDPRNGSPAAPGARSGPRVRGRPDARAVGSPAAGEGAVAPSPPLVLIPERVEAGRFPEEPSPACSASAGVSLASAESRVPGD